MLLDETHWGVTVVASVLLRVRELSLAKMQVYHRIALIKADILLLLH